VAGRIYVGIAGWSYKDWEDVVYAVTLKGAEQLAYLGRNNGGPRAYLVNPSL